MTDESTSVARTTGTSASGEYDFAAVTLSTYTLTVEAPGFKRLQRKGIVVETQAAVNINLALELGQVSEWRLIVKQTGADVETTVLRVDGDTGGATGSWQNGKFVASHFDGSRPVPITPTPQQDGTLLVDLNASQRTGVMTAYRPAVARAKGFPSLQTI